MKGKTVTLIHGYANVKLVQKQNIHIVMTLMKRKAIIRLITT